MLGLFTTRFALQALGIMDYGLFSVLGSIISFIGVFNTIMLSTCNRFIAVAIGKGDINEINKTFNINLVIFIGCALFLFLFAYPIGSWYINTHINYDGAIENAVMVFVFSVLGSIISTLATPYNGLLMAKERFFLFSFVDVAMHVIRFGVVLSLIYFFENKLTIYTVLNAITVALPALIYMLYCKKIYPDLIKWNFVKDTSAYKEVFSFSGWVAYGAIACVIRSQGAAILVNLFFNTAMNTALGVANTINSYVMQFANNLTQPMQPQITKSYAVNNTNRTNELLVMSTKFSFILMLIIGLPFFTDADWILKLWLENVPEYAVVFTVLLIIDNIIQSFNSGLSLVLFASGKIALYQIVINTLRLLAIVVAYFVLKTGVEPPYLFYIYILFSIIIVISTQWCLYRTLNYDIVHIIKKSYVPSLTIVLLILPTLFMTTCIHINSFLRIVIDELLLVFIVYFVGLSKKEKEFISTKIISKFRYKS